MKPLSTPYSPSRRRYPYKDQDGKLYTYKQVMKGWRKA